ncbi:hypothetical protein EXIGLDRAFT_838231 [Exidia glandulosa HHB12029]|uniref:Uncharacterized protein n=1 Tax=Exidia glandulosa HHB12029 TaxID=1314781 RepID=A0A165G1D7_EXIGL|nr:hypothetical protein EXIGLDRAFT_838231 [Exidia glandulosa HHB12029]
MAELNSTPSSTLSTATPDDSEFPLIPTRPVPAGSIGCNWISYNYDAAKQGRRICQSFVLDPSLPEPDGFEPDYAHRKLQRRHTGMFFEMTHRLNLHLAASLVDIDLWIIGPQPSTPSQPEPAPPKRAAGEVDDDGFTNPTNARERRRRKVYIGIQSQDLNLRIHSIDDSYEVLFELDARRRLDLALPRSYQGLVRFFTLETRPDPIFMDPNPLQFLRFLRTPADPGDLLMFSPSMRRNISHINDDTVLRQYFIGTYSRTNESVLHICLAKKVRVRFVDQPNPPVPPPPPVQPKPVSWWSWLWPFSSVTEEEPAW